MTNKKLKKIMTNLAAGHITQKEADMLIEPKKVAENKLDDEIKGKSHTINTIHTRKRQLNKKEVK